MELETEIELLLHFHYINIAGGVRTCAKPRGTKVTSVIKRKARRTGEEFWRRPRKGDQRCGDVEDERKRIHDKVRLAILLSHFEFNSFEGIRLQKFSYMTFTRKLFNISYLFSFSFAEYNNVKRRSFHLSTKTRTLNKHNRFLSDAFILSAKN